MKIEEMVEEVEEERWIEKKNIINLEIGNNNLHFIK